MEEQLEFQKGERRSFPRRRVRQPVVVKSAAVGGGAVQGETENLSSSGILIFINSPLAVGSKVELLFDMPTLAGAGHYPVRCLGRIVRTEAAAEHYAIGVAFEKVEVVAQA
jgi:hypothetical protein